MEYPEGHSFLSSQGSRGRKCSTKLDRLEIDLKGRNDLQDIPKNVLNLEDGFLEQLHSPDAWTGSVGNEEAVKGEKNKTESAVTESFNDGELSELIEMASLYGYT